MSEYPPRGESFADVESMVRAAGGYVQPTDDLRPRTLEAARDKTSQRRAQRRIGGLAAMVVLLAVSGAPDFVRQTLVQSHLPMIASSHELHYRAARLASDSHFGSHWALVDVFVELRQDQARRFGE